MDKHFLVTESFPLKYMFQAVSIMHIGKITFLEFTYDDQFPNYKLIYLNLYIAKEIVTSVHRHN